MTVDQKKTGSLEKIWGIVNVKRQYSESRLEGVKAANPPHKLVNITEVGTVWQTMDNKPYNNRKARRGVAKGIQVEEARRGNLLRARLKRLTSKKPIDSVNNGKVS